MAEYHPDVIQQFADRLYRHAATIVVLYTTVSFVGGSILGGGIAFGFTRRGDLADGSLVLMALAIGTIFGLMGFFRGRERGFLLRLQAQQALCQMKIEENTRRSP